MSQGFMQTKKVDVISLVSNNGLDRLDSQYLIIRMKSYVENVRLQEEINAISPQKIFLLNLAYQVLYYFKVFIVSQVRGL